MKKVILVSLDALAGGEYELIRQLPGFSKLLARGACCPQEESVYPTLTYPCHASMVTGCTPGVHGIVNNHAFHPGARIPHWNFYATRLKKPALWDYANRAGKKTLSMSGQRGRRHPLVHAGNDPGKAQNMERRQLPQTAVGVCQIRDAPVRHPNPFGPPRAAEGLVPGQAAAAGRMYAGGLFAGAGALPL